MFCPKCENAELEKQQVMQLEIERCPSCHGYWLDAHELERIVAAPPKKLIREDRRLQTKPSDKTSGLKCPRCGGATLIKLNSLLRPGTILDSCTVCHGTWLDAGELTKIAGQDLLGRIRQFFLGK